MYRCGDVILDTDGQQITHTLWGNRKAALLLGAGVWQHPEFWLT